MQVFELVEFLNEKCNPNDYVIAIREGDNPLDPAIGSEVSGAVKIETHDSDDAMVYLRY